MDKLLTRAAGIGKRVTEAADALKASPGAKWDHLELGAPQATPADALGTRDDLIVYKSGTILVKDGDSARILQTGDLVQIGRAWKLIDGPGGNAEGMAAAPSHRNWRRCSPGSTSSTRSTQSHWVRRRRSRSTTASARRSWNRSSPSSRRTSKTRGCGCWSMRCSAASEGEKPDGRYIARLKQFKDVLAKGPNPALAAFAAYRVLIAENNIAIASGGINNFAELQDKWRTALEDFYKAYPASEEAPEALLRLAMAYEYQKDGDAKAREWYALLAQKYAKHPHAAQALGAIKRLDSEGKPLDLVGPNLATGVPFNVSALQGKVLVVYYCAGWSRALPNDAKTLQALAKQYGPKGFELVTVCLDVDAKTAADTVGKNALPGIQLYAPGGLDSSPLASAYGILVVPHVFVVGKDGKVVNRNAQIASLEEDLRKLLP